MKKDNAKVQNNGHSTENTIDDTVAVKAAIQRYADAFESLEPQTMNALLACFSEHARFVDPFNDVTGKTAIAAVFTDMFEKTKNPRFVVDDIFINGSTAMLIWTFYFQFKKQVKTISVHGCSQVHLDENGKVTLHKDFWDPCQGLYEHVPIIGRFFRWLRGRLAVKI